MVSYNDYDREILSERPPLYDDDGYEMSSEDDEDGEAQAAANEFYPYNDVKIEGSYSSTNIVGAHTLIDRRRTPGTIDVRRRPAGPSNTFSGIYIQDTDGTHHTCSHDGTKGEEHIVAHEASLNETEWRSHMDTDCDAGDAE